MSAKRAEIAAKRARLFGPQGKLKEEPAAAGAAGEPPFFRKGDRVVRLEFNDPRVPAGTLGTILSDGVRHDGNWEVKWDDSNEEKHILWHQNGMRVVDPGCDACDYCNQYGCSMEHCDSADKPKDDESEEPAPASSAAAAAASSEPPKNERLEQFVSDFLTCSICLKPMLRCVSLPCSDMFCRYCINQWFRARQLQGASKKCANCRAVHTRVTTMPVPHVDRMIKELVCVTPELTREYDERLVAEENDYAELQESIKKERAEKEEQDSKDAEEALKGSDASESEEDEDFVDLVSESDEEEEEEECKECEEEEEPRDTRRSSRNAKPAAAAAASARATRGQKRK